MTLPDLQRWQHARKYDNSGSSDEGWKIDQTPDSPDAMDKMLDHWPGIKRALNRNHEWSADFEAHAPLAIWNTVSLVNWKIEIDSQKHAILAVHHRYPVGKAFALPRLVALHELGRAAELAEFIRQEQVVILEALSSYPHFALAIQNACPDILSGLNLTPEYWSKLREDLQRSFYKVQVRKAQRQVEINPRDDLNAPSRTEPDSGSPATEIRPEASPSRPMATATTDPSPIVRGAGDSRQTAPQSAPCVALKCLPQLSQALGGGFYWGEATMIAGINAAGKTLLAMQMADDFVTQGFRTVVFTTERRPDELSQRCVSNRLNINLAKLHGNDWQTPARGSELKSMERMYSENLRYVDWATGNGENVIQHFDEAMNQLERTGWVPQIIIFDWIGGGLDLIANIDHIPELYQAAADHLADYAKRNNRIVITCAQLNKEMVSGRTSYVDMSMLAECTAMASGMANFIGLTSMMHDDKSNSYESVYRTDQHLCLAKVKHGQARQVVPVKTVFHYQRFEESGGVKPAPR